MTTTALMDEESPVVQELLTEWTRDLREAAVRLTLSEVRFLVDAYYQTQEHRIATNNQIRAAGEEEEPNRVLQFLFGQVATLEKRIKTALDYYTDAQPVGIWLKSIHGIGPVIAAGLLAHIDITQAPTAGHIWSFAGLEPSRKWEKGQKRPWNARLKVLCWKAGQSFMKFHNSPKCFYGQHYAAQKEKYLRRNERGDYAERAQAILAEKRIGKGTEAYKHLSEGHLPPAQIDAMARRWVVKLFLSHLHEVWYKQHYGMAPPNPFAIGILKHDAAHYIPPPE